MKAMRAFFVGALAILIFAAGCKKDEGGTGPGPGPGGTITVNGFVKDSYFNPVSGAVVIVSGKTPVTSASNGSFSVTSVTTPYDVAVVVGTQQRAVVYQGLTRTDPVLFALGLPLPSLKSATITGNVPGAATARTRVLFVSGPKLWSTNADPTTGAYSITASWYDTATTYVGQLHVVRWTPSSGLPTVYDGYGSKNLTIVNGGTFSSGTSFTPGELSDPADGNISGAIVRPSGFTSVGGRQIYILFGNAYMFIAGESGTLGDPFSYNVANITGATFSLYTTATASNRLTTYWRTGLTSGMTGINVTLETAPQLSAPVNNATNIDTSISFLWGAGGGSGVNLVFFNGPGTNPDFYIFTTANSVRIPNLAAQGLGVPTNVTYSWYVQRYYPTSMDAFASDAYVSFTNYVSGDVGWLLSEPWNFTTRP